MKAMALAALVGAILISGVSMASPADDQKAVADLDTRYQAAVKANDAEGMAAILHDDFVLVIGNGTAFNKKDLLDDARSGHVTYTHQEEEPGTQAVRVWGDTAVVTAKLWLAGVRDGKAFERKLWFRDTYIRTPQGWNYAFGQASLPLTAN